MGSTGVRGRCHHVGPWRMVRFYIHTNTVNANRAWRSPSCLAALVHDRQSRLKVRKRRFGIVV